MSEVQYKEDGDNRVLRHVLCLLWEQQCHSCREFKSYLDLQIDHIVPKTAGKEELSRLKEELDLQADYNVHALYNLAPICGTCNKTKGNRNFTATFLLKMTMTKSMRLAPKVARQVSKFGDPSKLGNALLEATEVDLEDTETRETFEQFAPAVIQRLAELGEDGVDFFTFRTEEVEVGDRLQRIKLRLNERARRTIVILEEIAGGQLAEALITPSSALLKEISSHSTYEFEASEQMGAPDVESVDLNWSEITVDRVDFESLHPANIDFAFSGRFEAAGSTTIARDNMLDGALEYVQGDTTITGRFEFNLSWSPGNQAGQFEFDDVVIEDWEADLSIEGGSYQQCNEIVDPELPEEPDSPPA
ncbi:HNH endonuclease signature motif containing protein [Amycolatopsis sp. NPDC051371]|uniref:HNH endonuclease signature motif containing protein n=1 Tax=Amycolatopsis sp. NPDC051371 TaxID=3155800 RepID=UPI003447DE09